MQTRPRWNRWHIGRLSSTGFWNTAIPIGALGGAVLWVGGDQGILSGARPACVVSQNAEFLDGGSWFTQRVMHSEILSPAQQSALAVLSQPPELYDFYLAGGTALALHL